MAMTWTYKHGAVGKVLTGTLSNNGSPTNLTNKTVTLNARRTKTSDPILDDLSVTVTNALTGAISWTVTADAADADLVPENLQGYLLEFKVAEGATVDYFPTDSSNRRTYGRLIVQKNLA